MGRDKTGHFYCLLISLYFLFYSYQDLISSTLYFFFHYFRLRGLIFKPIAFAGYLDYLGILQKAVQDGRGGGHIADEFAPFVQRPVGGHDVGTQLMAAHDLKEILA